jgi:hypothetical protein
MSNENEEVSNNPHKIPQLLHNHIESLIKDNRHLRAQLEDAKFHQKEIDELKHKLFEERNSSQSLTEKYDQYGNQYEFTADSIKVTTLYTRFPFEPEPVTESRLATLFFAVLPALITFIVGALFVLAVQTAKAGCDTLYVKPGLGFKLDSERYGNTYRDDPYFVRLEAGIECDNLVFGVSHGRQIYSNKRFFETKENHYKSAVFIDYKFGWKI